MPRDYIEIARRLRPAADRRERVRAVVDALWDGLSQAGASWVGIYVHEVAEELTLEYCRNKPACSPIGLHGACGQSFVSRRPLIVRDVASLGKDYIACDPRDRSELVVPLIDDSGHCWGVLDLDSYETGAYDASDLSGIESVLRAGGLLAGPLDAHVTV